MTVVSPEAGGEGSPECGRTSGAEGYRFEPYRAYQPVNNLAGLALLTRPRGQAGDKFLVARGLGRVAVIGGGSD